MHMWYVRYSILIAVIMQISGLQNLDRMSHVGN